MHDPASSTATRVFSRKAPLSWPLFLTAILAALVLAGTLMQARGLMVLAVVVFLPATLVAWPTALRKRGEFLELSDAGIRVAGHEIPWQNLDNLRVLREAPERFSTLRLQLKEPLTPHGFRQRLNSFLSRGASDRELLIPLNDAEDKPAVIDDAIRGSWRRAVGEEIPFAAEDRLVARYRRDLRKFRELSTSEKCWTIGVTAGLFLMMGWCWHGIAAPFLSSAAWARMSGWFAAVVTAIALFMLLRKTGLPSLRNQQSTTLYLVMFVFVFLMLTTVTWMIVARSVPDVFTRLAGTPREFTTSLRKEWKASGSSSYCEQHVTGAFFEDRFPSIYCPDPEGFARLPAEGLMRVIVRESWFGLHIDRIEPIEAHK